ncbi:hypothetical protein Tfer_2561 [Thermincola ferriacetica]|uniref:Amino acid permease n=1 Tax=Thermincola ferriacetica TaxID=281456 RepID=A0A0L6W097_9FIRM|nr:APC family permease [Thermincola ferriacetica]KNZ68838.1 hypothetical protein Tfer_2561 [Thermincola ferriacetica]
MTTAVFRATKKFLLGRPLRTSRLMQERLGKARALAVFSSDALSSVAYATEEILMVLVTAGTAALRLSLPVALVISALLVILITSYRQTIYAYPNGGGAYIVAKDNLGTAPGLVAAAALLTDYVLTVAVSISAGVAAITSAFPALLEYRVAICLFFIALVTLANLRGMKESATIFAVPTYIFVFSIYIMIFAGLIKYFTGSYVPTHAMATAGPAQGVTLYLILRAFSSGCSALTGVEAISNGVPAFRPPESKNAGITLVWMGSILMTMFVGITLLARFFGIVPVHDQTVVSQIAAAIFGRSPLYFLIQASTTAILVLAANTSFADFPRLASLLAKDGFMPRFMAMRGDKLVFSNGIITLGFLSAILVIIFGGSTHALIPLYAVGVFLSFTLSQSGMVVHWLKTKEKGWVNHALINGLGALATSIAVVIIARTKFLYGAWVVIIIIPVLVLTFLKIHRHYSEITAELDPNGCACYRKLNPIIIVPIANINKVVINTIEYAKSMTDNIIPVHICISEEGAGRLKEEWKKWNFGVDLLVIPSPYRSIFGPLLRFIDRVEARAGENDKVTVLIPEFVPRKWWHYFLHNQTGMWLKFLLLMRKDIVISSVPYHLKK